MNNEQVGTGNTLLHLPSEVAMELAFENAVSAAGLLLLAQLNCVFADLRCAAMLAGGYRDDGRRMRTCQ